MNDKEFVLAVYPNAIAKQTLNKKSKSISRWHRFDILVENKMLAVSFKSEDAAWKWAKSVVNSRLINKLAE